MRPGYSLYEVYDTYSMEPIGEVAARSPYRAFLRAKQLYPQQSHPAVGLKPVRH
jgi:hypothetical protein